jgi:glutathione S-transferase
MERGREGLRQDIFPFLETQLADAGYLAGGFSLADIPFMALAMVLQVDGMDVSGFPRSAAYLERLRQRPSYRVIDPRTPLAESAGREGL